MTMKRLKMKVCDVLSKRGNGEKVKGNGDKQIGHAQVGNMERLGCCFITTRGGLHVTHISFHITWSFCCCQGVPTSRDTENQYGVVVRELD